VEGSTPAVERSDILPQQQYVEKGMRGRRRCVSYIHSCMAEFTYWSGKSRVVLKATSA